MTTKSDYEQHIAGGDFAIAASWIESSALTEEGKAGRPSYRA